MGVHSRDAGRTHAVEQETRKSRKARTMRREIGNRSACAEENGLLNGIYIERIKEGDMKNEDSAKSLLPLLILDPQSHQEYLQAGFPMLGIQAFQVDEGQFSGHQVQSPALLRHQPPPSNHPPY
ncbi:unnamed protein product [Linum trigynum]|uniref:Uncharacterized protein n=1 Tax=Linum trigynum TaxID=586398 RepID=A0AAV2GPK8_9ROSI